MEVKLKVNKYGEHEIWLTQHSHSSRIFVGTSREVEEFVKKINEVSKS